MTIYTRGGDEGETGLSDGSRVRKDDPRVEAYGHLDELNSILGFCRALSKDAERKAILLGVQKELHALASLLANPRKSQAPASTKAAVRQDRITEMESLIDRFEARLKPLKGFVVPGGTAAAAALHVARTVCRRAERRLETLRRTAPVPAMALPYLNRLSDLLFTMAREENREGGLEEEPW